MRAHSSFSLALRWLIHLDGGVVSSHWMHTHPTFVLGDFFFRGKKQGTGWVVNAPRLKVLGLLFGFRNMTNALIRREYNSSLWLQFFVGSLQSWVLGEYNSSLIDETSDLSHLPEGIKQYTMYLFTEGVVHFLWHVLLDIASQILNLDGRGSTTKSRWWC